MRQAWSSVERNLPKDNRRPPQKPYAGARARTQIASRQTQRKSKERCPSSIERSLSQKSKQKNPFGDQWPLAISRSAVEADLLSFAHAFDFIGYLREDVGACRKAVDFLLTGFVPRTVYHVTRYVYTVFVAQGEALEHYVRAKALWHIMQKRSGWSLFSFRVMSIALMAIKVCTAAVFEEERPGEIAPRQRTLMEATIFKAVDDLLNPFEVYDSLEKPEDYRMALPDVMLIEGKRELEDIIHLLENGQLASTEEMIARSLLNREKWDQLCRFLTREKWGDVDDDDSVAPTHVVRDDHEVQRLIESDLAGLTKLVPKPPPDWIKSRNKAPLLTDDETE
jgi:hypothetical protein